MIKKTLITMLSAASAIAVVAAPSILSLKNTIKDDAIVYPESFETDTHKMMQNWYLQNYTDLDKDADSRPDVNTPDEVYIERLSKMPTTIEMPFNQVVKSYIERYVKKGRSLVENMLGMSLYYMPIFEQALESEGLPNELKYLPIIESALNPEATSRAGAAGLWQFMVPTAHGYGLEINSLIDERRDPIRSSEAAAKLLKNLHEIYGDWSLAIAAYNCGPGNVNKALRRVSGDQKDFWAIYNYLPKETRGYVPCFIAANYAMTYYKEHNISPALARKPIITDSIHINQRVHFNQIANVLNMPVDELRVLNPQYRKDVIPGDTKPYSLVLPSQQVYSYIMSEDSILAYDANRYSRRKVVEPGESINSVRAKDGGNVANQGVRYHKVRRGETIESIAQEYGVTVADIQNTNGVTNVKRGQTLKILNPQVTETYDDDLNLVAANDSSAVEVGNIDEDMMAQVEEKSKSTQQRAVSTVPAPAPKAAAQAAAVPQRQTQRAATPTAVPNRNSRYGNAYGYGNAGYGKSSRRSAAGYGTAATGRSAYQSQKQQAAKAKSAKAAAPASVQVKDGDNLYNLAKRHGTTVEALKKANGLKDDKIKPGQRLNVGTSGAKASSSKNKTSTKAASSKSKSTSATSKSASSKSKGKSTKKK